MWGRWKGTLLRIIFLPHLSLVVRWKDTLLRCAKALSFMIPPGEGEKTLSFVYGPPGDAQARDNIRVSYRMCRAMAI
ncbi:uncharacterized protein DS421_13g416990 [Arachis hypogaea]|nr:uncharacterized protein DS421_13g416990 [Arachis hypogaea]